MKSERLKGKISYPVGINQDYKEGKFGGHHPFFDNEDIKSAVAWFKLKLDASQSQWTNEQIINLLHISFEDVIDENDMQETRKSI